MKLVHWPLMGGVLHLDLIWYSEEGSMLVAAPSSPRIVVWAVQQ